MSNVAYVQEGAAIDYTPSEDLAAGDVVVLGDLVGVAKRGIPADAQGALHVEGVYDFPKASGGGVTFSTGDVVYWNAGGSLAVATDGAGANKAIGKAVADAADGDATVRVRMSQ